MMGYEFGPGLEYAVLRLEVLAEANGAVRIRASGMRTVGVAAFNVCDLLGVSLFVHSRHVVSVRAIESRNGSKPGRPLLRNKLRSTMIRHQSYQLNLAGRSAASSSRLPVPVLVIAL